MEEFKQKAGKLNWNLVNLKNLEGLVRIREYGVEKYKDPENWKKVNPEDCFSALKRHIVEMDNSGIYSLDKESNLRHLDHSLCNLYFMSGLASEPNEVWRGFPCFDNNCKTMNPYCRQAEFCKYKDCPFNKPCPYQRSK